MEKKEDYKWCYSVNLLKNSVFILMIFKSFILGGMWVFLVLFFWHGVHRNYELFPYNLKIASVFMFFILIILVLAYLLTALVYAGKYTVEFEMDDFSIKHTHIKKRRLRHSSKTYMQYDGGSVKTIFQNVTKIIIYEKKHVIRLKSPLTRNYIYTSVDDFTQVKSFILEQCCANPNLRIKSSHRFAFIPL